MPSKVFMICDAYESGFGHGLQDDGHDNGADLFTDPELAEAYTLGYQNGLEKHCDALWNKNK